jgi:hypothetical protein
MTALTATNPTSLSPDSQLREALLSFLLDTYTSTALSEWLSDIGQDGRGSKEEKQRRVREHTQYLSMPAKDFPRQTDDYLRTCPANLFADLCEELGLSDEGTKGELHRRIMREIHYREGWMTRVEKGNPSALTVAAVASVLAWFPITKFGEYERDYYPIIRSELEEVFGDGMVWDQTIVGHGNGLKIDFHVGDLQGDGVGIEVKLPLNNSDTMKAIGQLSQYRTRYGDKLILFVVGGFLKPEILRLFTDQLAQQGVAVVVR